MAKPKTYGFRATNPKTMKNLDDCFWRSKYQELQNRKKTYPRPREQKPTMVAARPAVKKEEGQE